MAEACSRAMHCRTGCACSRSAAVTRVWLSCPAGGLSQTPCVKLAWQPVAASQGVSHYNVYRSDTEAFQAKAETLLGSPSGPVFYDVGLEAGQTAYYRVRAIDAWGNQSPASAAIAVTAK